MLVFFDLCARLAPLSRLGFPFVIVVLERHHHARRFGLMRFQAGLCSIFPTRELDDLSELRAGVVLHCWLHDVQTMVIDKERVLAK